MILEQAVRDFLMLFVTIEPIGALGLEPGGSRHGYHPHRSGGRAIRRRPRGTVQNMRLKRLIFLGTAMFVLALAVAPPAEARIGNLNTLERAYLRWQAGVEARGEEAALAG